MAPETDRPLRERHRDVTRETILSALAEIAAAGNVHGFTVQQVADRAGVAHRTVYRHFPTRESLLEALAEWLDEELGRRGTSILPHTLDALPGAAVLVFSLFDEYAPQVRALAATYASMQIQPPTREQRTRAFRQITEEAASNLPEADRRAFFAVVRTLMSSQAWQIMHDQLGMEGEEAGRAVAWAVATLGEDVRIRNARAAEDRAEGEASGPRTGRAAT